MRVLDIEYEADVGQLLLPAAMIDVMHHEDLGLGHVLDPGAGHAARHPASEGIAGDDEAELEFGQFRTLVGHQMLGGNDTAHFWSRVAA